MTGDISEQDMNRWTYRYDLQQVRDYDDLVKRVENTTVGKRIGNAGKRKLYDHVNQLLNIDSTREKIEKANSLEELKNIEIEDNTIQVSGMRKTISAEGLENLKANRRAELLKEKMDEIKNVKSLPEYSRQDIDVNEPELVRTAESRRRELSEQLHASRLEAERAKTEAWQVRGRSLDASEIRLSKFRTVSSFGDFYNLDDGEMTEVLKNQGFEVKDSGYVGKK